MSGRLTVYVSVDVEADGPIPGPYSMVSFGAAVCGRHTTDGFTAVDPAAQTFYRELRPISTEFDAEALAVSGLDRAGLQAHGADPAEAMTDFRAWVSEISAGAKPVVVGYPACYDWMFLYWYLIRFGGHSPFGHSGCMDMKTLFAEKARRSIAFVGKRSMPKHLLPQRPHTHNALDDAIEQGELFANLMAWDGGSGRQGVPNAA
jgi:hypothetical protein